MDGGGCKGRLIGYLLQTRCSNRQQQLHDDEGGPLTQPNDGMTD
jgi:hypothetical protein